MFKFLWSVSFHGAIILLCLTTVYCQPHLTSSEHLQGDWEKYTIDSIKNYEKMGERFKNGSLPCKVHLNMRILSSEDLKSLSKFLKSNVIQKDTLYRKLYQIIHSIKPKSQLQEFFLSISDEDVSTLMQLAKKLVSAETNVTFKDMKKIYSKSVFSNNVLDKKMESFIKEFNSQKRSSLPRCNGNADTSVSNSSCDIYERKISVIYESLGEKKQEFLQFIGEYLFSVYLIKVGELLNLLPTEVKLLAITSNFQCSAYFDLSKILSKLHNLTKVYLTGGLFDYSDVATLRSIVDSSKLETISLNNFNLSITYLELVSTSDTNGNLTNWKNCNDLGLRLNNHNIFPFENLSVLKDNNNLKSLHFFEFSANYEDGMSALKDHLSQPNSLSKVCIYFFSFYPELTCMKILKETTNKDLCQNFDPIDYYHKLINNFSSKLNDLIDQYPNIKSDMRRYYREKRIKALSELISALEYEIGIKFGKNQTDDLNEPL